MLMKLGTREGGNPDGIGVWSTGLSWYDEGVIHPITAKVVYAFPQFEVVDVVLDYDKRTIEIPPRMVSMIVATTIDEYLQAAPAMKQKYDDKAKMVKVKKSQIDPFFEE